MAGGYGSKKNGVRIGVFWDGIELNGDGSQARVTDPRINIDRDVNISDSTNNLSWDGGAVVDGSDSNINVSGSGAKRIKSVSGQWQTLAYGATTSANFGAQMTGVDYAGGTLTVDKTVTYPARPYDLPNAPTGVTAVRVSDTSQTVSWSRVITTAAPWQNVFIERMDNVGGTWAVIASYSGNNALGTSYTDTTTVPDRLYTYRVRASNTTGYSAYGTSNSIPTTPVAATALVAAKNPAGDIVLTWDNGSTNDDGYEISRSDNGGAFATLGTFAGADVTTYTDVAPNPAQTHAYRVRLRAGTLFSEYSSTSNTVQLLTNPNPPTGLANGGSSVWDATGTIPFSWVHNPVDSTAQTKYQVRYRTSNDGVTWTAWTELAAVVSSASAYTMPANTLVNGKYVEWGVRTWGGYVDPSAYSASLVLRTSQPPTMAFTAPAATHTTSAVTPAWTYTDPEGTAQANAELELYADATDTLLWSGTVVGAATSYAIPYTLANSTDYYVRGRAQDATGMWSAWATRTFTTDFPDPPTPTVSLTWDLDRGAIVVAVTNPAGSPAVTFNDVYRSTDGETWELAGTVPPNSAFSDPVPPTGVVNYYRATAHSALPSQATSATAALDPDPEIMRWAWFNSGPGFSVLARCRLNPGLKESYHRSKVVHRFDGRDFGVPYSGQPRYHEFTYTGTLETDRQDSTEEAFRAVVDETGTGCYRDAWYRWYVSYESADVSRDTVPGVRGIQVKFERVDNGD